MTKVGLDIAKTGVDLGVLSEGGFLISSFRSNSALFTQGVQFVSDFSTLGKDLRGGADATTLTKDIEEISFDIARAFGGLLINVSRDIDLLFKDAFQLTHDIANLGQAPPPAPRPQPTPQPGPSGETGGGSAIDFDNDGDSDFGGLIDPDNDPVFTR
jgi:hypothetical protein